MKVSEHFFDISGGKIFVKSWHPAQQTKSAPIILLHDSLGCVATWRDFPELLCQKIGRPVIAYDRLGFGRSSPRAGLPSEDFIEEEGKVVLPKLLDILGISQCVVFGHSVGGGMAISFAGTHPEKVFGVISESAQAFVEARTREGIQQAERNFQDPQMFAKLEKYHGEKTGWVLDAWIKVWLAPSFADWSLKEVLPRVKSPMLIIHGAKDEFGSKAFPEFIKQNSAGKTELKFLPDNGHVPHRESPELILNLVQNFFSLDRIP